MIRATEQAVPSNDNACAVGDAVERTAATLSPSKINTYRQCPKRFELRFVHRIPERRASSAMLFGKAIHHTLDVFHGKLRERVVLGGHDLAIIFEKAFADEAKRFEAVTYSPDETRFSLVAEAMGLMAAYTPFAHAFEVKEVEHKFVIDLVHQDRTPTRLEGRIDLVVRDPARSVPVLYEFKTTKRPPNPRFQDVNANIQMTAYAFAYERVNEVQPDVVLAHLVRGRTPRVHMQIARPPRPLVEGFPSFLEDVRSRIESRIFPKNPSRLCHYCPYESICMPSGAAPAAPAAPSFLQ